MPYRYPISISDHILSLCSQGHSCNLEANVDYNGHDMTSGHSGTKDGRVMPVRPQTGSFSHWLNPSPSQNPLKLIVGFGIEAKLSSNQNVAIQSKKM